MNHNHINSTDKAIIITFDLAVTVFSTWVIQKFASQITTTASHDSSQKTTYEHKYGFLLAIGLFSIYKLFALHLVLQFEQEEAEQLEPLNIIGDNISLDFATDFDDRL